MKKIILRSITVLSIICLLLFFNSCKELAVNDEVELASGIILQNLYVNDGPLASVASICNVLSFDDETHFESTYQYLDNRYEANQDRDSTASLDAFQNSFNYKSRRNYVDAWETGMENQGTPIDETNDIDTLFFGDDVMKTLISTKGIVKIGNDAVLILDECLWIRVPFNDCQGKILLEQLFDMLHLTTIGSQEDAALFILDNDIILEDRCSSFAESSGCGFRSDFTYTNPVLNTSTNEYEFELTDVSPIYQTVPQLRIWRIADAGSTAKFVRPGGFKKYDTRTTVKIRVPITEDFVTIKLSNTTLIPFCQSVVPKTIYFGCPYPDWNYVNDKTIQFTTKNAEPGTQVLWKFGDNNSSSSTNQNPQFHYANADCPDKVVVDFVITAQDPSTNPNCHKDFNPLRIEVGPKEFLLHKKASGWKTVGGKKFKWSITAKGRPNLFGIYTGLSSVRSFIKYKEQRNNGKWRTKRTNLKIRLEGGLYRYTDCTLANDLTTATSEKSKNNRRRLWKSYTSTTPFQINVNDPIKAYFEAGSLSGTFTVFN